MNDSALTIDQLDALSRAVPDDQERKDIRLYLQVCWGGGIKYSWVLATGRGLWSADTSTYSMCRGYHVHLCYVRRYHVQ